MQIENMTLEELQELKKTVNKRIMVLEAEEKKRAVEILNGVLTEEWQSTEEITAKVISEIKHNQNWICGVLNYHISNIQHRTSMTIYLHSHAIKKAEWRRGPEREYPMVVNLVCPVGTPTKDIKKWIDKHSDYQEDGKYHYVENGDLVIHFTRVDDGIYREDTLEYEAEPQ